MHFQFAEECIPSREASVVASAALDVHRTLPPLLLRLKVALRILEPNLLARNSFASSSLSLATC
jgi:hypothetical protein